MNAPKKPGSDATSSSRGVRRSTLYTGSKRYDRNEMLQVIRQRPTRVGRLLYKGTRALRSIFVPGPGILRMPCDSTSTGGIASFLWRSRFGLFRASCLWYLAGGVEAQSAVVEEVEDRKAQDKEV